MILKREKDQQLLPLGPVSIKQVHTTLSTWVAEDPLAS
jgi:hypothetical protein